MIPCKLCKKLRVDYVFDNKLGDFFTEYINKV